MIDLQLIETEINELKTHLCKKEHEYEQAKENNLREKFGSKLGCDYCAYSCCVDVGDRCTYCVKRECIYCNDYCYDYMPENKLSEYIREHHYYAEYTVQKLNSFFGVSDIMKHQELHQKALDVLDIRDKKEE